MIGLIFGLILLTCAVLTHVLVRPEIKDATNRDDIARHAVVNRLKTAVTSIFAAVSVVVLALGAFQYNDAGYLQHVRTIAGTEAAVTKTGWYFEGWGASTSWPRFVTIANTNSMVADGSSVNGPYRVRLADNWTGDVTQSTRFKLPTDPDLFKEMAKTFRSPERLITTTLAPAVNASIDSVANMFTMEEYYSGGKRDQFKSEFEDAVKKGRARVIQVSLNQAGGVIPSRAAANDDVNAANTADVGDTDVRRIIMEKVQDDETGEIIRSEHAYLQYGITADTAILENIDPDDEYERQINERKQAASRRVVAREQRLEQEEQRLLAIQSGQTEIAKRQASAQVEQIEKTTNAETEKQLALIVASRMQEEAAIARETAAINLERARIDAEAVTVEADAEAYAKEAILLADGALAQKLEAWVAAQTVWADAASKINVPSTVFSNGGGDGTSGNAFTTVDQYMQMMTMKAARDLQVDVDIAPTKTNN